MKKLVIAATLLMMTFTNVTFTPLYAERSSANLPIVMGNPVDGCYFVGRIGGDNDAWLQMPYGNGYGQYKFINYVRNIRFGSWNSRTSTLIINAYEKGSGKYIGRFVGKITYNHGYPEYKGVFTNYKGGKVNFSLISP